MFSRSCPGSGLFCGGAADPGVGGGRPGNGMRRINEHRVCIKYQLMLVLGIIMLSSCGLAPSIAQDQLFSIAVSASFDEQQEVLQSDASGMVTGYEFEIFVTKANETHSSKLTDNSANDWFPSLSPDGSKIAFVSDRDGNYEIYIMNIDGTDQTNITNRPGDYGGPVWSPDGTQIAFISQRDGNYEIYMMDNDGGNQTNLTNSPTNEYRLSWSPDGSKLAFDSNMAGKYLAIYVMDLGNLEVTRLTHNQANDFEPKWSPDGSKIAFISERDGNEEIYLMNHDGSNQVNLTQNPADDFKPVWAIDGEHIIFASHRNVVMMDTFRGGQERSFVMKIDGSNQMVIPNYSGGWIDDVCCRKGHEQTPSP
jgi:Tol biopolymer transport system component